MIIDYGLYRLVAQPRKARSFGVTAHMAKTLCDWSKADIKDHWEKLIPLISHPHFYCRKCARSASNNKVLCKPTPIPRPLPLEEANFLHGESPQIYPTAANEL